jgi:hypothetical protein
MAKVGLNPGGMEILPFGEAMSRERAALDAALDAAIPGASDIVRLHESVVKANLDHHHKSSAEIARGTVMTAVRLDPAPAERLASLLAANPRAAAYLDAKLQHDGAHWADNAGVGAAGKAAMEILLAGGSVEEARDALAVRRESWD